MSQIAVKNLQSLNNILEAEKLNYEKFSSYLSAVKDSDLKNLIADLVSSSASHYNSVYKYLKSHQS